MNAITYIRQRNIEEVKEVLSMLPHFTVTHMTDDARMFVDENNPLLDEFQRSQIKDLIVIDDLKRLIESVDLVGKVGGITKAKAQVKQAHEHGYLTMSIPVEINGSIGMGCLHIDTLEQAIIDYEAIYSGEQHV